MDAIPTEERGRALRIVEGIALGIGVAYPLVGLVAMLAIFLGSLLLSAAGVGDSMPVFFAVLLIALPSTIALAVLVGRHTTQRDPEPARWAAGAIWLAVLPAVGFAINATLDSCDPCSDVSQALHAPGTWLVAVVHTAAALAWALSRARPRTLPLLSEVALALGMVLGMANCAVLTAHFSYQLVFSLFFGPLGLAMASAPVSGAVLSWALIQRLWRLGIERAALAGGLSALGGLAGVAGALPLRLPAAYVEAYTLTCHWGLSLQTPVPADCHYLCTVAAHGSPWLVRPYRVGRRHGQPILVNRQLAVANAFEDLLHERWPRFGRFARRTYDRLGLPISRYIRWRWAANAVFLAMIPAQWAFYATLLALDPGDPEARIDRMYR